MKRREFLGLAALPLAQAIARQRLNTSRGFVVGAGGASVDGIELVRDWNGTLCRSRVTNHTSRTVQIKEVAAKSFVPAHY